jgi:hypothetical protein
MTACSSLPDIEPLKDRFIYLIEGSRELNVIFFGKGLPVYDREGILSDRKGVYSSDLLPAYDTLTEKSPYFTVDSIKERAEQLFSESYLDLIYESAFDGVVASGGTYLRFYEYEGKIYQSSSATDFDLSERFYDYSTMKIVTPSNNEYINVTVITYTSDNKKPKEITLSFAFERGDWYLDCPTY